MAVETAEFRFSTRGDGDVVDFTGEETVPIVDGRLALGTWQQLVLIDFDDRPRERTVVVQVTY